MKRSERGFTVVEVAVTLLIFSVISFVIFDFLDRTTSSTNRTIENVNAEQTAQNALRAMTQDIRSANPIGAACTTPFATTYANCLRFTIARPTSGFATCESSMVFGLVGTVVRGTRVDSATCPSPTSTRRDLITVANTATQPLFTYYDLLGKEMPLPPTAGAAAPIAARSVKITLVVKYRGQTSDPLVLTSVAALRNNR